MAPRAQRARRLQWPTKRHSQRILPAFQRAHTTAVVNFRPEGAGGFDVSLPVILNVTQVTTAAANPAQLNFAFQASNLGATTNNKVINVSSSPSANLAYTATVTGDSRVSLSKSSTGPGTSTVTGTTPENVYVLVNPVGIAAGTTVNASVSIVTTNNTLTVPVQVMVTNAPLIVPSAESVTFNYSLGSSVPQPQSISLTSTTGQLPFAVTEAEVTGGDWLTVGTNAVSTPGNFSVSVNQTRAQQLPAGTYTANVTIASPGAGNTPLTIPVTLTVTGTAGLLNVSTAAGNNTLTFNADLNGQVPANQTVSVSSTDNTNQAFTISVDPATASWVLLGSRSGQTGTTGTFFNVGVSPSAVPAAGKQEADVVITPTTAAGTTPVPQKVHVVFNVNATTTVTATPARVEVTQAGTTGQAPSPVNVQLTSAVSGITFNASTQPSVSWLTVEPQSGTLNPTATIRLTFNTTGLAAGRHGDGTEDFTDGGYGSEHPGDAYHCQRATEFHASGIQRHSHPRYACSGESYAWDYQFGYADYFHGSGDLYWKLAFGYSDDRNHR